MIEVQSLSKRYGDRLAVDDLTFSVAPGVVTGFLGPNGAGKSTTMRLVLGLDHPTSGRALVNGAPYGAGSAPLHDVGSLLEANAVHPGRSARSHLAFLAVTNGIPRRRVDEVLELVGLTDVAGKRAKGYSLGMGQRLGIAAALLGDPGVLMFDEPVNGLDPEGILWIRRLLRSLAAEGRTVFVSSHLMSEMSLTAEHLIVIGRGRLIADSPTQEFIRRSSQNFVRVRSPRAGELADALRGAGGQVEREPDGALAVTQLEAPEVGELAAQHGLPLHELVAQQASLEEAFMELTHDSVDFRADAASYDTAAGGGSGSGGSGSGGSGGAGSAPAASSGDGPDAGALPGQPAPAGQSAPAGQPSYQPVHGGGAGRMTASTVPPSTVPPSTVPPSTVPPTNGSQRVSGPGIVPALRGEWIKTWTVRSTYWSLLGAVVAGVGLGAAISAGNASDPGPITSFDPTAISLAGLFFAQLAIGVVAILAITAEFGTGLVRATFAAVPRRGIVLCAKTALIAAVALVIGELCAFAAFLIGQAILSTKDLDVQLGDPGVLRAVVGGGLYIAVIAVFALGLATLIRHTAGAITVLVAVVFIVPVVTGLLPDSWQDYTKYLPATAGGSITSVVSNSNTLSPWTGFGVFCAWAAAMLLAGWVTLVRRDA